MDSIEKIVAEMRDTNTSVQIGGRADYPSVLIAEWAARLASFNPAQPTSGKCWHADVGEGGDKVTCPDCKPIPADESGADVCKACKGSGEVDGYVEHPSGDPQDAYAATVTCPQCDGTGDAPPAAPTESVVFQGTTAQLQSAYFGDWSAARAWAGKNGSVTMHTVRQLEIVNTQPRAAAQEGLGLLPTPTANLLEQYANDCQADGSTDLATIMREGALVIRRLTQPAGDFEDAAGFWSAVCAWTWKHRGWSPAKPQTDELLAALDAARRARGEG